MARTGRPKAEKPFDHKVTVKFKEEEYQIMVEYAESHNLSISQLIRLGVELQLKHQSNQYNGLFSPERRERWLVEKMVKVEY